MAIISCSDIADVMVDHITVLPGKTSSAPDPYIAIVCSADKLDPLWGGDFLMRAVSAVVLAIWATSFFAQPAFAEKRVALVIGNSAYQNVGRLANPGNASGVMAATLNRA